MYDKISENKRKSISYPNSDLQSIVTIRYSKSNRKVLHSSMNL